MSGVRVGIDIGGTFTDLVLATVDGRLCLSKVSSTPRDPSNAVVEGLQQLLDRLSINPFDITEIVHGTTVGSNTILERSGACTGLITTRGFRDILEIGRIRTPAMFNLAWEKPEPLVERHYRREISERVAADGSVVLPIDLGELETVGGELVSEGVEAIAVCFINSYANSAHEKAAVQFLRKTFPRIQVTGSYEVLPEIKEYERTSTTVVNAYLLPRMRTYLQRLADRLKQIGVRAPLQVMASNGGIMGGEIAARLPVFVVASGPAGGVTGSAALARGLRERDFVVFDMGGTTAKASILEEGRPALITEYEFRDGMSSPSRFIKGGGYMLKVPAIDIAEVGAGGGSLAFVDQGGLLRVGPESAGAVPGPACYGLGNQLPTVTDANMCLGYLNSEFLAGGSLKVQRSLAEAAVANHVGSALGLSMLDASHGIRQIANVNMARAIRSVTVERGKDPREMTMIAFGGNGPLHAIDVARILGIKRVVAPVLSGVFAAAGMLCADVEHNFVHASSRKLADVTTVWLMEQVELLKRAGRDVLSREGYDDRSSALQFFADLRYSGQSSELSLPFALDPLTEKTIFHLAENFRAAHKETFGYATGEPVEIANLRLTAIGQSEDRLRFSAISIVEENAVATPLVRRVSLERGSSFHDVPLIQRSVVADKRRAGPVIIESYDTTILIPPGCSYSADPVGNVVVDIET